MKIPIALVGTIGLVLWSVAPTTAQNAEDELGNWLIYNGTIQFSDRWSIFTEAQFRLYEVVSEPSEFFVRAAPQYNFNPDALVAVGYLHAIGWPYDKDPSDTERTTEDRIYEQFTIKSHWDRTTFEHRYRVEQRWIHSDLETDYRNRFRYRLQVTSPLNRPAMEPGAFFINAFDEIFIAVDKEVTFDQNRLYGAAGYQFASTATMQIGYLFLSRTHANFHRLQFFLTYNFDLR